VRRNNSPIAAMPLTSKKILFKLKTGIKYSV
jgi:hypothetical protein